MKKLLITGALVLGAVFAMDTTAEAARTNAKGAVDFCKRWVERGRFDSVGECMNRIRSASRWAEVCRNNWERFGFDSVGDCVSARQANGGNDGGGGGDE